MRQDLTEIILIVDRSGSMSACQEDAEGGINTFIEEQKKGVGEANLTLVQFDTRYDFVYKGTPIGDVTPYRLRPAGMTALLDAVGRAISETDERLAAMTEADRPATVICVIVTDGKENASREYTLQQVKAMIEEQRDKYSWHFNFLGANADVFDQATNIGIRAPCVVQYNLCKPGAAYRKMSEKVTSARKCTSTSEPVDTTYTDEDRKDLE